MRAMERAVTALERVLPLAAAVARVVRVAAFAALGSAALIALVLFRDGFPEPESRAFATAVVAVAAFVPGAVLLAFHVALRQLLRLPARLRSIPGTGREHAAELARIVGERGPRTRLPLRAWRLFALGRSSRELLTPHAPLVPLFSPPFLLASLASLLVTPVLVVAALVALATLG